MSNRDRTYSFLGHLTRLFRRSIQPRMSMGAPPPSPSRTGRPFCYRLFVSSALRGWICSVGFHSCVRTQPYTNTSPPPTLPVLSWTTGSIVRKKEDKRREKKKRGPQRRLPEPSRRRNRSRLLTTLATLSVSLSLSLSFFFNSFFFPTLLLRRLFRTVRYWLNTPLGRLLCMLKRVNNRFMV